MWWNGRRVGLKIRCWRQHVGSSPTTSTNVPRFLPRLFLFLWLGSGSVRVVWVEYSQGACSCFPKVRGRHRCKGVRKQWLLARLRAACRTQNPMLETTCGFKSHHQHQCASGFARGFFLFLWLGSGSVRVVWVEYSLALVLFLP